MRSDLFPPKEMRREEARAASRGGVKVNLFILACGGQAWGFGGFLWVFFFVERGDFAAFADERCSKWGKTRNLPYEQKKKLL